MWMCKQAPPPVHTPSCVKLQVIYRTSEQKPSQTLIYHSGCVGESTKQQRVDDNVPRQALPSVRGLLNAVTGSRCGRALHLSASLSPPLHSSIPRSRRHYRCHQIAMMQGKPWSGPRVPHPPPERESKTGSEGGRRGEKITIQRREGPAVSAECWE